MSDVKKQIEKISSIFHEAHLFAEEVKTQQELISFLESNDNEFRSVAYEGAAMALALKDFSTGKTLHQWSAFMEEPGAKHTAQIHVGLGWAIAQLKIPVLPILENIKPIMQTRVADGCGYYEGMFRQKQLIKKPFTSFDERSLPEYLDEKIIHSFVQGIGRSIWYLSNGEINKMTNSIQRFSEAFHGDLWRGTGIACAYAGGCDESQLKNIFSTASFHSEQLKQGASLAAGTRYHAGAITKDVDLACRVWCNLSVEEAMISSQTESVL